MNVFFDLDLGLEGSVLVLGSGMCAPALVQYLDQHDYKVILASRTLAAAQKLAEGKKHVVPKYLVFFYSFRQLICCLDVWILKLQMGRNF